MRSYKRRLAVLAGVDCRIPQIAGKSTAPMERLENRLYLSGGTGLRADYYNAASTVFSASTLAVTTAPVLTRTDSTVDFDWGTASPAAGTVSSQNFAVRWSGQVMSEQAGTYVFHVTTGAAIRLWVNGQEIINDYAQHATSDDASIAITLQANTLYNIQLDFAEGTSTADDSVMLEWVLPNGTRQVIPAAQLYPFSGPLTITSGGIYVGSWQSTNHSVSAVTVATSQPVTIEDSIIQATGILVSNTTPGVQLTIENSSGYGLNPNIAGVSKEDFLYVQNAASLDIQNNFIDNVGGYGISVLGDAGAGATGSFKILYNYILNADGRYSDGNGGYESTGDPTPHDIIFNSVHDANVEIAWNQIINQPFQSYVNDIINIYNSSGTAADPILIHDNYIQGLYAIDPNTEYDSGTGIITDGGSTAGSQTAYVNIYNNMIVSTGSAGIGVAAGHDVQVYDNTLLSSGLLPDGSTIYANCNGIFIQDFASGGSSANFYNNGAYDNATGWMEPPDTVANGSNQTNEANYNFTNATASETYGNTSLGVITPAMEAAQFTVWQTKLTANNVTVGLLVAATAPAPTPTPTVNVADAGGVYTGSPYAASGLVTGVNNASLGTPTFTYYLASDTSFADPLAGAPSDVGSYVVVASYAANGNYTAASASASFSITPATPTVNFTDAGGVYNGAAYAASGSVTGVNNANLGTPTLTYYLASDTSFANPLGGAPNNVGSYVVIASYAASGDYTAASAQTTFSIVAATPTVNATDAGGVYNGSAFAATGSVTGVNNANLDMPTFTYYLACDTSFANPLSSAPSNVGSYVAVASYAASGNYAAASAQTTFSIAATTPTVSVIDTGGIDTGSAYAATGSVTGVNNANLGTPTFTYYLASDTSFANPLSGAPSDAGLYVVVASYAGGGNYAAASDQTSFEITAATPAPTPTVSVTDAGGVYNGSAFAATGSVTGVNNADLGAPTFTYYLASDTSFTSPLGGAPSDVGSYVVVASYAASGDYAAASAQTSFSITPATPTVNVADAGGVAIGSAYPATGSVTGVNNANLGTPTFTYYLASDTSLANPLAGAPSDAGSYIVVASYAAAGNYAAASAQTSFTISAPSVTSTQTPIVTVTDAGGTYNGSAFTASGSVSGVDSADLGTPTFTYYLASDASFASPLSGAPTDVGSYVVVASYAANGNYTSSSAQTSFSITPATPTVNVADAGGVYNGSAFAATGSVTGVNNANLGTPTFTYYLASDTSFANPLAGAPSTVSSYVVVASYAAGGDYTAASAQAGFAIIADTPTPTYRHHHHRFFDQPTVAGATQVDAILITTIALPAASGSDVAAPSETTTALVGGQVAPVQFLAAPDNQPAIQTFPLRGRWWQFNVGDNDNANVSTAAV